MLRFLIVPLCAFVLQIFFAAMSVPLGLSGSFVLIAPVALILAVTQFALLESLASVFVLGFLLDCWLGTMVGVTMGVLGLLWFACLASIAWLGKPDFVIRTAFIFVFSLAFRVCVALALGVQGGSQGNWEWMPFLVMPFFDVAIGIVFYRFMMRFLTLLGLCELRENTSQRLARRPSRISLD